MKCIVAPTISCILSTCFNYRVERVQQWDVFQTYPPDEDDERHESLYRTCYRVFRFLTIAVIFVLVIACASISKAALLYAASNAGSEASSFCSASDVENWQCVQLPNANDPVDNITCVGSSGELKTLCSQEKIRWMWSLFFMTISSYLLVFARNMWFVCFKSKRTPDTSTFFIVSYYANYTIQERKMNLKSLVL